MAKLTWRSSDNCSTRSESDKNKYFQNLSQTDGRTYGRSLFLFISVKIGHQLSSIATGHIWSFATEFVMIMISAYLLCYHKGVFSMLSLTVLYMMLA